MLLCTTQWKLGRADMTSTADSSTSSTYDWQQNSLNTNLCTHNYSSGEWWSSHTVYLKVTFLFMCTLAHAILFVLSCPCLSPTVLALIVWITNSILIAHSSLLLLTVLLPDIHSGSIHWKQSTICHWEEYDLWTVNSYNVVVHLKHSLLTYTECQRLDTQSVTNCIE